MRPFLPRTLVSLAISALCILPFAGCGDTTKSKGTIGISLLALENPFFKIIGDNATAEAKKHGYTTIVLSADKDVAKQSNQIKDFIVKKVSAIVLSPCDSKSIVPVIQEANAAGIPVFTVDIPCNEPGVKLVTQIATDNYAGGKEAAAAVIEKIGGVGGTVAILHFKQAESCQLRVKGFRDALEKHNETAANKITVVSELEGGGATDIGRKAAADALQANPNLSAIFAINDPSAIGAATAVESAGRKGKVVIVGFDGEKQGKLAIKNGSIYADPIQFPAKMGVGIIDAFVRHSKGETLPAQTLFPTKLYRQADAADDPELK